MLLLPVYNSAVKSESDFMIALNCRI